MEGQTLAEKKAATIKKQQEEENNFEDIEIEYNDPNFKEKIQETEIIEEDIELLMTRGADATVERLIPVFNFKTGRYARMKVDLNPLSRGDMIKIEQQSKRSKKEDKDTLLRVVAKGYKPKGRGPFTLDELRDLDNGFLKAVYDQISFISGTPIDGFTQFAVKQAFEGDT